MPVWAKISGIRTYLHRNNVGLMMVCDASPTLNRHYSDVFCVIGYNIDPVLLFMLRNASDYILLS